MMDHKWMMSSTESALSLSNATSVPTCTEDIIRESCVVEEASVSAHIAVCACMASLLV